MINAGVSYSNNVGRKVSFAQDVAVNNILLLKLEDYVNVNLVGINAQLLLELFSIKQEHH